MLVDEIEFIIAKAKLDVELKFNEDQPRDENGRFAETDGSSSPSADITIGAIRKEQAKIYGEDAMLPISSQSDRVLKSLIRVKGFDEKPKVVATKEELTGTVLYRGVHSSESKTAPELVKQFSDGDMFVGQGIFGNGVYFASEVSLANKYAYGQDGALAGQGAIITGALDPEAKILEISSDWSPEQTKMMTELQDNIPREIFADVVVGSGDISRVAVLNDYDAVHVKDAKNGDQYIILNRGAMQVVA
jgi:hypothetical protein